MPGATRSADSVEVTRSMMAAAKSEKKVMEAKVARVRDVVKNFSKEEIVLVLQHFELDEEKTIQAFCDDGAKDALDTWSGGSATSAKKKRNRAKKTATNGHVPTTTTAIPAAVAPAPVPVRVPQVNGNGQSATPLPQRAPKAPRAVAAAPAVVSNGGPLYVPPTSNDLDARQRTTSTSSIADAASKKKALEKEVKLMSRHDANMLRVHDRFDQEMDKSADRLRRAFQELREKLAAREASLSVALAAAKADGARLLAEKEAYGRGLHARSERAPNLSEQELDTLRHDIKDFTSDMRTEEEFASTLRFLYEPDAISALIASFGTVVGVKPLHRAASRSAPSAPHSSRDAAPTSAAAAPAPPVEKKNVKAMEMNGITMRSESLTDAQLEDINRKLQESLLSQGISSNVMGLVGGQGSGPTPVASRRGVGRGNFVGRGGRGGAGRGARGGKGPAPAAQPNLSIFQ